jgi:WD40 repeat protein
MLIDGSRTSRLYRTSDGQPLKHELHEKGGVAGGRFTFVKDVVVSAPWEGGCTLWNLRTGQSIRGPSCRQTKTVACAPNGKWMAVGQFRGKVGVVDIQNNQAVVSITAFSRNSPVEGLAFSHDNQFLAMVTRQGAGKIYQLPGGVQTADLGSGLRTALAFTPDGRLLVASQSGGAIQVRSPKTGERLGAWQGHSNTVRGIAASSDGLVVTASSDMTARVWRAKDGVSKVIWKHTAPLAAVGFSPDYQHFAVVGEDGAVQVWKVTQ